jgi:ribonuclease HII
MYVIGVDEAGRGSIAGPVSVGLVRVPEGLDLRALFPGLNDSKQVSEPKRERLMDLLEEQADALGISYQPMFRSAADIDGKGIAVVIRDAIAEGLALLGGPSAGEVRLDGSLHAPDGYRQTTIIRGDSMEPAIMLASIVAKVSRDRLMRELDALHSSYGFAKHKGYGTAAHYAALKMDGLCVEHRRTFLTNLHI